MNNVINNSKIINTEEFLLDDLYGTKVSKVIDENGEPLVVYHGDNFDFNGLNREGATFKQIYAANEPWGRHKKDYPIFLNIRNPRIEEWGFTDDFSQDYENVEKEVINKGYDGAIGYYEKTKSKEPYSDNIREFYVINPNQIKSATDNIGTYSEDNDNIHYYKTAEEEFDDFFSDSTDIKNAKQLDNTLEKGKDYTIDKLIELFDKYSTDKEQQALAKKVFNVAKKLNFKVQFLADNLGWNIGGLQDGDVLKIARITTLERNKETVAQILLHETIHGVTTYAIRAYNNKELTDKKLIEAVEELKNVYDAILDREDIKNEYGLQNEKELIAELANPNFRNKLKKINIWERLKNAIKKIFFFFEKEDVNAEAVLSDALDKFLDNYDVNLWNTYNVTPSDGGLDWNFSIINNDDVSNKPNADN